MCGRSLLKNLRCSVGHPRCSEVVLWVIHATTEGRVQFGCTQWGVQLEARRCQALRWSGGAYLHARTHLRSCALLAAPNGVFSGR